MHNSFNPSGIQSENVFFHDVPKNHYAFIPVSTLTEMGLISVNEDRKFYPESYIKPVEAAKIILYALNYGTICSFDDDYVRRREMWLGVLMEMREAIAHRGRDQTHAYAVTQVSAVGFLTHCVTAGTLILNL